MGRLLEDVVEKVCIYISNRKKMAVKRVKLQAKIGVILKIFVKFTVYDWANWRNNKGFKLVKNLVFLMREISTYR